MISSCVTSIGLPRCPPDRCRLDPYLGTRRESTSQGPTLQSQICPGLVDTQLHREQHLPKRLDVLPARVREYPQRLPPPDDVVVLLPPRRREPERVAGPPQVGRQRPALGRVRAVAVARPGARAAGQRPPDLHEEARDEKGPARGLLADPGPPELAGGLEVVQRGGAVPATPPRVVQVAVPGGVARQASGRRLQLAERCLGGCARDDIAVEKPDDLVEYQGLGPSQGGQEFHRHLGSQEVVDFGIYAAHDDRPVRGVLGRVESTSRHGFYNDRQPAEQE